MNSKYLFLSDAERLGALYSYGVWKNLPTLSQSTRECYLTIINCKIIYNAAASTNESLNIKMKIPSSNYFSSDNSYPIVAFLNTTDKISYAIEHTNEISILTTDNLKSIEFILEDNFGDEITLGASDTMEVMIKLDYIDQLEQTELYISQKPRTLD